MKTTQKAKVVGRGKVSTAARKPWKRWWWWPKAPDASGQLLPAGWYRVCLSGAPHRLAATRPRGRPR
jgi:hypothetical protein